MAAEDAVAASEDKHEDSEATAFSPDKKAAPLSMWGLMGPGLLACLADTDAGCLMVAAQSGASWGYSLLLLQIILIPILYFAQELTVRLAVYTRKGHAACIKAKYGSPCAWFTSLLLMGECVITIISEMSGIAATAQLWGMSKLLSTILAAVIIILTVVFLKYRQIETIGIALGLFELTFVITMCWYHPAPSEVFSGLLSTHFDDRSYLFLWTANLGAVLMPFMIYFQQSAVVARRLTPADLTQERVGTLFGSCLTQLVMIGTLVTYAAAFAGSRTKSLESVQDMNMALEPVLGPIWSKVMISLALVGGSLCAAFVSSLAASWTLCDTAEMDDTWSVDRSPSEAPRFYGIFLVVVILGVIVLQTGVHVVTLNVFIELINGLLMPMAVGFLYALACSDVLPEEARLKGGYKILLGVLFSFCAITAVAAGVAGLVEQATTPSAHHPHSLIQ